MPPGEQHRHHAATILHISTEPVQEAELYWTMESTAVSSTSVDPDKKFMTEYQRTCTIRETDGSYTALFPWKPNHPLYQLISHCVKAEQRHWLVD